MRFPIILRWERSRRHRTRSICLLAGIALTAAIVSISAYTLTARHAPATPILGRETIEVTSDPSGASIKLDGRTSGRTPARIRVTSGDHAVELALSGHATVTRQVSVATGRTSVVVAQLWQRSATVTALRPPLPGATIRDARFLADGTIALDVTLPHNMGTEAWRIDAGGRITRVSLMPLPTTVLALGPDATSVAYLKGRSDKGPAGKPTYRELWVTSGTSRGARLYSLPTDTDHGLVDLSWAPDGRSLLVIASRRVFDGSTSRLLLIPADEGEPREVASVPAEVVSGSYNWSPADTGVAFLARHGDTVSLCAVRLNGSAFRYLADVGRTTGEPVGYAPISWSRDGGRVLYSAPDKPNSDGSPSPHRLYSDDLSGRPSARVASGVGQSPVWREDGHILALARAEAGKPPVLRSVDPAGAVRDIGVLPIGSGSFSVRWDVEHAQAIVAVRAPSSFASGNTLWLTRWTNGASK